MMDLVPIGSSEVTCFADVEHYMLQQPQVECPVTHSFAAGLYVRTLYIPAGTLAIGHRQRLEHHNVMLAGRVMMLNEDGTTSEMVAPCSFVGQPGRKIGYVLEDVIWQNIYPQIVGTVEDAEALFLEKSETFYADAEMKLQIAHLEKEADREDYKLALAEMGIPEEQVQREMALMTNETVDGVNYRLDKSPIHGTGVFVDSGLLPGDVIGVALHNGIRTPLARYVNHSKTPNARNEKFNDAVVLVATARVAGKRAGQNGDEVVVDYRQSHSFREIS